MDGKIELTQEELEDAVYHWIQDHYNMRIESFVTYSMQLIDGDVTVLYSNVKQE